MLQKLPGKPEIIGKYSVNLDGQSIDYTLKKSHRARLIRLMIDRDSNLVVTVPWRYSVKNLNGVLEKKRKWIIEKCRDHKKEPAILVKKQFSTGDYIPYLGKSIKLLVQSNFSGISYARRTSNTLLITVVQDKQQNINSVLELWYRMEADSLIRDKAGKLGKQMDIRFNNLTIRGQRTRWGSCSRKGNLSFNWKLIMAPNAVIDYVIIHELAHIKEMNHSKNFWNVVAVQCPHYKKHRKWLREHDAELNTTLTF
jgi:predicted metal-dependent hydrolase